VEVIFSEHMRGEWDPMVVEWKVDHLAGEPMLNFSDLDISALDGHELALGNIGAQPR
jgi:hypothetical protein